MIIWKYNQLTQKEFNNMVIIGHRGAKGYEPENTLASFQKAITLGVDMIELDVYSVKTGEIVVMHDQTVDRTTNGTGPVTNFSFTSNGKSTRLVLVTPNVADLLSMTIFFRNFQLVSSHPDGVLSVTLSAVALAFVSDAY